MQVIYKIHTMLDHRHAMSLHVEVQPYHGVPWSRRSRPLHLITRKYWLYMKPAASVSGWGRWPNISDQIVGWARARTHRPWCMRTMQHALLSSKTATSKETGRITFCPSSSSHTSCRKLERSKWFKCVPATTQPTCSPNHFWLAHSGSSRIKLVCVDWKTFSEVHIRGSNTCCTLFSSSLFCPTGFSW